MGAVQEPRWYEIAVMAGITLSDVNAPPKEWNSYLFPGQVPRKTSVLPSHGEYRAAYSACITVMGELTLMRAPCVQIFNVKKPAPDAAL